MSYFRGVAIDDFTFQMVSTIDGSPIITGTVTGRISKDGGTQVELINSAGGTGINHLGNGQYKVTITKEEMDADSVGFVFTHTNGIPAGFTIPTNKSPSPLVQVDSPGDVSTLVGQVRMLINDNDGQIFIDAEIDFFLSQNEQDIYFAGADALETMASGAAQKNWLIRTGTKTKDFRQLAKELRAQAQALRERSDNFALFEFAEQNVSVFSSSEITLNRILREGT